MQGKCARCGESIILSAKEKLCSLLFSQEYFCVQCKKIIEYENDTNIPWAGNIDDNKNSMEVHRFNNKYYEWLDRNTGKRCALKRTDGSTDIVKLLGNQMGLIRLISEETGNNFTIPIYEIDRIVVIGAGDRRYSKPDGTFMSGYKGVDLYKGVLGDGKWIYEIGIPYVEEYRDPFSTDFQDVYSHYCKTIEDVLWWGRDFIDSPLLNLEGKHHKECRLFEVRAEGHYFQNTRFGWVSNKITLLREVPQEEIIEYFNNLENGHDRLYNLLRFNFIEDPESAWKRYCSCVVPRYRNDYTEEETLRLCVENSPLYGSGAVCKAINDIHYCLSCTKRGYCFEERYNYTRYCYLSIRSKIHSGKPYLGSTEYNYLVENNRKKELEAIERLCSTIKK